MSNVRALEEQRIAHQTDLDAGRSLKERNRLGQFATPGPLAEDLTRYAATLIPPGSIRFLDPAIGTGAFYSALLRTVPGRQIHWARGFEIDERFAQTARRLWRASGLSITTADFTHELPPSAETDRATLLITNPPYVRHHHLRIEDKAHLQLSSAQATGIRPSGLTGLYGYFLLLAHPWMARDAIAGWLIPSEFLDVNYGRGIKNYLLSRVTLLRIHRYDPNDVQFNDALVSSAVVWFKNSTPPPQHNVEFTAGGTHDKPAHRHTRASSRLAREPKWSRLFYGTAAYDAPRITLNDIFTIRRGIATGSNSFFILTRAAAAERNLPPSLLTPILPSPRYLTADEIQADADGYPQLDPQLTLLNCSIPEEQIAREYPTVATYLDEGKRQAIDRTYLCTHRTPWYAQERRTVPPLLCTYMGRGEKDHPFRFILNHSRAIAANVYLLLYPKPGIDVLLREDPKRLRALWLALKSLPATVLLTEGRVYGGGLYKLEPRELANATAEPLLQAVPEIRIVLALQEVLFEKTRLETA